MGDKVYAIIDWGRKVENGISYLFLFILVSLSSVNVFMRYFLNSPIQWTEEILVSGFIWLTFWSIALCYRSDNFIHIDFIDQFLTDHFHKILSFVNDLLIFIFSFVILYWSLRLSLQASVKVTNILRIPYSYINISLFLGFLMLDKEIILKYLKNIRRNI